MNGFRLREWNESDVKSVAKYADNKKIADNLRDGFPFPYTETDASEFIKAAMSADKTKNLFLAIEVEGEAVGSIGVFLRDDVYRKSAEMGYWLAEPFWGMGIITSAVKETCVLAFDKYDIVRIYAEPYAYNEASRRVLEKAGFALEGILRSSVYKNGHIHDSCMYALLRN